MEYSPAPGFLNFLFSQWNISEKFGFFVLYCMSFIIPSSLKSAFLNFPYLQGPHFPAKPLFKQNRAERQILIYKNKKFFIGREYKIISNHTKLDLK